MKQRIAWIDLFKLCSICVVIFTHASWSNTQRLEFFFPFSIDMAVPVFMLISGVIWSYSIEKHDFLDNYQYNILFKRWFRFTLPLLIAFLLEILIYCAFKGALTMRSAIVQLYLGGYGPGSYYYPIMIQLIFYFPVIYLIVQKHRAIGVFICGIINFIFEFSVLTYGVSVSTYRLLIFRYTLLIALGVFFYLEKKLILSKAYIKWHLVALLIGFVYIHISSYTSINTYVFEYWTTTSMLVSFWVFPFFCLVYFWSKDMNYYKILFLGKASYHIFLTQMVYYNFDVDGLLMEMLGINVFFSAILSILICLPMGYLFYLVEGMFSGTLYKLLMSVFLS